MTCGYKSACPCEDAENSGIYSVFASLYSRLWNKTRGHKRSCLWRRCPKTMVLKHFCLFVHIFASLYNISKRTLCAVFCPKMAFKKNSQVSKTSLCAVFLGTRSPKSGGSGDFEHKQDDKFSDYAHKNLEFSTFSGIQNDKTHGAAMSGITVPRSGPETGSGLGGRGTT